MLASITSTLLFLSIASPESATTTQPPTSNTVVKQQAKGPYESRYGLTLSAGSTSGIGIGVRKHFKNRFGFHITGLPIVGADDGYIFAGGQGMYSFVRRRIVRLYGLLGTQLIYNYSTTRSTPMVPAGPQQPDTNGPSLVPGPTTTWVNRDYTATVGAGLGLELHFNKRFSWALELPITVLIHHQRASRHRSTDVTVLPIPNTAITLYY